MAKTPRQKLEGKLDVVFSKYIRLRDASGKGNCRCCTCGRIKHWKEVDAGHFISRRHKITRWDETNVHAQCRGCNRFQEGRMDDYWIFMENKYSKEKPRELNQLKYQTKKFELFELEEMIEHFTSQVKKLEKKVV